MQASYQARKPEAAAAALTELGNILDHGDADAVHWGQLGELIKLRTSVILAESQRMQKLNQFVTVEKTWTLIAALVQSVRANVQDSGVLTRIQRDFKQLTGRTDVEAGAVE